jgi:hypothetical protein
MTGSEGASGVEKLGLASGVGLVIAVAISAGVFVTTGFMAQSMGPLQILLAWLAGSALALAGTRLRRGGSADPALGRRVPLPERAGPSRARYFAGWGSDARSRCMAERVSHCPRHFGNEAAQVRVRC